MAGGDGADVGEIGKIVRSSFWCGGKGTKKKKKKKKKGVIRPCVQCYMYKGMNGLSRWVGWGT